jgi:hypothetical protein
VENNNLGALGLYKSLGFERFEVVEQWQAARLGDLEAPSPGSPEWVIRRRGMDEIDPETELLFKRARRGAMAWTRPFERGDFMDPALNMLGGLPGGRFRERWLIHQRDEPSRWMGIVWNQSGSWSKASMCAFFDPALEDTLKAALLRTVLSQSGMSGRAVRLETSREGEWQEGLLREAGFRQERALVLMRRLIN